MAFPPMRQGIAMILRKEFPCGAMSHRLKECQKRWQRHALTRFYRWKKRNRLAPSNLYKQQCEDPG